MSEPTHCYCGRCTRDVVPVTAWPGFRWVKRAWYAGVLLVALLMPIILAEITVLLPMALVFAMAAGPVHSLAAQRSTCSECGAEVS